MAINPLANLALQNRFDPPDDGDDQEPRSTRVRTRYQETIDPGAVTEYLGPYTGMFDVQDSFTNEEFSATLEDGKIPFSVPRAQVEEVEAIPVDFSRSREALQEFAEAKVQAAKQGSIAGVQTARVANQRLLANALGPALLQSVFGARMPDNQVNNYAFQASRLGEQAAQGVANARQVEAMARAEANLQGEQLRDEENNINTQRRMQTDRFNAQRGDRARRDRTAAMNQMSELMMRMAQGDREAARQMRMLEREMELKNSGAGMNGEFAADLSAIQANSLARNNNRQRYNQLTRFKNMLAEMPTNVDGPRDFEAQARQKIKEMPQFKGKVPPPETVNQEAQKMYQSYQKQVDELRKSGEVDDAFFRLDQQARIEKLDQMQSDIRDEFEMLTRQAQSITQQVDFPSQEAGQVYQQYLFGDGLNLYNQPEKSTSGVDQAPVPEPVAEEGEARKPQSKPQSDQDPLDNPWVGGLFE